MENQNRQFQKVFVHLATLEEKVDNINKRLDVSNGKLLSHDTSLNILDHRERKNSIYISILWSVVGALGLTILGIISAFVNKKL